MFVLIVNRSIAISNICSDAQGNGSNIKNNEVPVQKDNRSNQLFSFVFMFFTIILKKTFRSNNFVSIDINI